MGSGRPKSSRSVQFSGGCKSYKVSRTRGLGAAVAFSPCAGISARETVRFQNCTVLGGPTGKEMDVEKLRLWRAAEMLYHRLNGLVKEFPTKTSYQAETATVLQMARKEE